MLQKDFKNRALYPVLIVLLVMTVSHFGYFGSRRVDDQTIRSLMAAFFGTVYFGSVALGALYVFTTAYVRGASPFERILASLVTPLVWMTKEVIRLTESHPLVECLYWYLNPLNIWLVSLVVMEMGLATLLARRILRKRGHPVEASSGPPLFIALAGLSLAIGLYAWGRGENIYVLFLKGYRLFFGSGVS